MKQCRYCGEMLPDDALACNNCGRPFPDMVSPDGEILRPKKKEEPPVAAQAEEPRNGGQQAEASGNGLDWRPDAGQQAPQGGWNGPQGGWHQDGQQWNHDGQQWQQGGQQWQDSDGRGTLPPWQQPYAGGPRPGQGRGKTRKYAALSMMFGIMSSYLNAFFLAPSIAAIILGIAAIRKNAKEPENNSGVWMAFVGLGLGILFLIVYIFLMSRVYSAMQDPETFRMLQEYIGMTGGR